MAVQTMEGVSPKTITTKRITTRVLFSRPQDGVPVLFLHGNLSSATWWEETMVDLPGGFRGIAPDQRGYGDADPARKIDARLGMGDLAEDAVALLDELNYRHAHIVGISLGGNVLWKLLMDHPGRFLSATVVNPGSPYGFGATKDAAGTPTTPDFSGSGGGLSNPDLIQRILDGDRSMESPTSPRSAIRTILVKPPFIPLREDALVESLLTTHIGDQDIPGDSTPSPHWPHISPGIWGGTNALSPKYAGDVHKLAGANPKPHILWVRGSHDLAVSNTAASDPGYLGRLGLLPGWPGEDVFPPQPMIDQTRAVLEKYTAAGGSYREYIIQDAGHLAYLEKPDEFNSVFHDHIQAKS
jgi:pimeloyl-ACP methyl ester carboxylesterase